MGCTLATLGACLPDAFVQVLLDLLNAALAPLLSFVETLLTQPVDLSPLKGLWLIIVSTLGLFYGLAFLYAGFNFIIAGFDVARKEAAKLWLKNILMMLVSVQASYWLYGLLTEMGGMLTAGVFSLIPPDFFLLTANAWEGAGATIVLTTAYVLTMLYTVLLLMFRYILVVAGVLFFPIGLFLYFLPPLKSLGQLILSLCLTVVFVPFFASIGLLISSKLAETAFFAGQKALLMLGAFCFVNFIITGMLFFAVIKSALSLLDISLYQGVTNTVRMMK